MNAHANLDDQSVRDLIRLANVGELSQAQQEATLLRPLLAVAVQAAIQHLEGNPDAAVRLLLSSDLPKRDPILDRYRVSTLAAAGRERESKAVQRLSPDISYSVADEGWSSLADDPERAAEIVGGVDNDEAREIGETALARLGKPKGIEALELRVENGSASAALGLAWALQAHGEDRRALRVLELAFEKRPEYVALLQAIACALVSLDRGEEAKQRLIEARPIVGNAFAIQEWLASYDLKRGLRVGEERIEQLLEQYPESVRLSHVYGPYLLRRRRIKDLYTLASKRALMEKRLGIAHG